MVITRLGVNIDHVATLRQIRLGHDPEPVAAALMAQSAGAQSISMHLRGDRRHVQDRDARLLREVLSIPLNVACAATPDAMESVIPIKPHWATLVPETREELATQGGLDVVFLQAHLRQFIRELHTSDIRVSLFIDAQMEQVKMASRLEADGVELNTGNYTNLPSGADNAPELERLRESSKLASRLGLRVSAGRGPSGDRGIEHRPRHCRAGPSGRHGTRSARDAGDPVRGSPMTCFSMWSPKSTPDSEEGATLPGGVD
jgi:pyridoxine 5-phosphate synthase